MIYVGIDNGISGTIGVIDETGTPLNFLLTQSKHEQSYTKTKKNIGRLQYDWFYDVMKAYASMNVPCKAIMERPMINPGRFDATISAVRCLEAMLICLEHLNIPHQYIDSKQWQRELLPAGIKGSEELKKASMDIGCRLFPQYKEVIMKHKDADGILIAEWARRNKI